MSTVLCEISSMLCIKRLRGGGGGSDTFLFNIISKTIISPPSKFAGN